VIHDSIGPDLQNGLAGGVSIPALQEWALLLLGLALGGLIWRQSRRIVAYRFPE